MSTKPLQFSASRIGERCDRKLLLDVLGFAPQIPEKTQAIFEEGHNQEKLALQELAKWGVEFYHSVLDVGQKEFFMEVQLKNRPMFIVSSHPDAIYVRGRSDKLYGLYAGCPIEIKGLNPIIWSIIKNTKDIPPRYYDQIQIQMLTSETERGLFIARNKGDKTTPAGKHIRILVHRNEPRIREILKRLSSISEIYYSGKYPKVLLEFPNCDCFFLEDCKRIYTEIERNQGGIK